MCYGIEHQLNLHIVNLVLKQQVVFSHHKLRLHVEMFIVLCHHELLEGNDGIGNIAGKPQAVAVVEEIDRYRMFYSQ